jgi:hypothetical protein
MREGVAAFASTRFGHTLFARAGPVGAVFLASLLLSAFAVAGKISPNNDGMLYVEAAQLFQQGGFEAARQVYDWLFYSVLIALVSSLTGMHAESVAYALAGVMLAALGALLVDVTRMLYPQAAWAAVVIVLALPALNGYRDFIIREHGMWLFVVLSVWLSMRWSRRPGWLLAFASQASVGLAALFRPEALIFVLVPLLCFGARRRESGVRPYLQFLALPLVGGGVIAGLWLAGHPLGWDKMASQLQALALLSKMDGFRELGAAIAPTLSPHLSDKDAAWVIVTGAVALIPIKFATNLGLFVIPLLRGVTARRGCGTAGDEAGAVLWAVVVYGVVLLAFVLDQYWLSARFVVLLNLLVVPFVAYGTCLLWQAWPRWRWAIVLLIAVTAVAHVASTSPKKTRYAEAAAWVAAEPVPPARIYFEEKVVAYLAGFGYHNIPSTTIAGRTELLAALEAGRFDLVLLDGRTDDEALVEWASRHALELRRSFRDDRGRAVYAFEFVRPAVRDPSAVGDGP